MTHTEENTEIEPVHPLDRKVQKRTLQSVSDRLRDVLKEHFSAREKGSGIVSPLVGMAERIQARADRGNGLGEA